MRYKLDNQMREQFESIGFVYQGLSNNLNFNYSCFSMKRGFDVIEICEELNQVGFDFLFYRMVQDANIAFNFFKKG